MEIFWQHHSVNTSFPGGHSMFTFAMATVVSHEYPQKWVQALAYSAATIVTVTRFMARDHWSSDMFAGAVLGIGIGAHNLSCALQSGIKRFVQTPRAVDLLMKKNSSWSCMLGLSADHLQPMRPSICLLSSCVKPIADG